MNERRKKREGRNIRGYGRIKRGVNPRHLPSLCIMSYHSSDTEPGALDAEGKSVLITEKQEVRDVLKRTERQTHGGIDRYANTEED